MGNQYDKLFLRTILIINLIALVPIILRKPPIKDWLLVYMYNAITNVYIDNFLSIRKILKYPIRLFPNAFNTNFLFDFLIYPTFTIIYNQITYKEKPFAIFYKLLYFAIPMALFESWAVRKTNLIEWEKGWKWYHSFISITIKSLVTRMFIEIVRKIDKIQEISKRRGNFIN